MISHDLIVNPHPCLHNRHRGPVTAALRTEAHPKKPVAGRILGIVRQLLESCEATNGNMGRSSDGINNWSMVNQ